MSGIEFKKRPGVTLLELSVTIAVGAVIFLILGAIFLAQGQFFSIEDAIAETQVHAYQAIDTVGLYMPSATRVVASKTINGTTYTTGDSIVVLELPSVDSSGTIVANTYDYIALGQDLLDPTHFMFDIESATGTDRLKGKFTKALFVDKVIFRYNTVDPAAATAVDLYVRTTKDARGRTIVAPVGKIYYLSAT